MDLPPTIPTSFVPQSAAASARRFRSDFTGAFGFFAYGILALVLMLALGVFLYGHFLSARLASKDIAVAKAEASVDAATIEDFVRLRERLDASTELLDKHVALSGFFAVLEALLPSAIRLDTIHLSMSDARVAHLDAVGVAKSFNTLAFASSVFATDGRIKDAIFSGLTINKDGSVSFTLSGTLSPKIVTFTP